MAGRLELLVVLWKAWGVQGVVLLSFAFQVTLLVTADIRRLRGHLMLSVIIWSSYVLADTMAVYALGHMSVAVTSPEHELMALWAPLLLVHLGGQDNITAYAIEDNRLWVRHLQTFAVQVLAAAYVVYESSILGRNTLLRPATVLMFVVGILKYAERVWALVCANNCASSSLSATNYKDFRHVYEQPGNSSKATTEQREEEDLLFKAYMMLDVPKQMFEGPTRYVKMDNALRCEVEDMSKVVGMQLSMMHEILYTKAAIVHTWYGRCIRIISLLATTAALLLFHASTERLHGGYNRVDVAVTNVLLVGAVVLEITSLLRTIFSPWTRMHLHAQGWYGLSYALRFLARPIRLVVPSRRYWSGYMGQNILFNMIYASRRNLGSKIARCLRRGDWWDSIVYSFFTPVSRDIIQTVIELVSANEGVSEESPYHMRNSRGRQALRRHGIQEDLELEWNMELDLDESIIVWHVATELYSVWSQENKSASASPEINRANTLSYYMLYLLATRPYMLPYPVSRQKYVQLCYDLITAHKDVLSALRKVVGHTGFDPANSSPAETEVIEIGNETLSSGWRLALKLISINMGSVDSGDTIKMISEVWAEMLCYTAYRCNENYHAKHLSNGGEILTFIALLMLYMSRKRSSQPETPV